MKRRNELKLPLKKGNTYKMVTCVLMILTNKIEEEIKMTKKNTKVEETVIETTEVVKTSKSATPKRTKRNTPVEKKVVEKPVDLVEVVEKAMKPIEKGIKPTHSKGKLIKPAEEVVVEAEVVEVEKPKVNKPAKPKAEGITNLASIEMAKMFPQKLEVGFVEGGLTLAQGRFKTIKSIAEAIESGQDLYFACYWTPRHLVQFDYGTQYDVPTPKKGFPDNIDFAQVVMVCEIAKNKLYAMSAYTEAMYSFKQEDLKEEDGIRFVKGMEFQIYVKSEEVKEA